MHRCRWDPHSHHACPVCSSVLLWALLVSVCFTLCCCSCLIRFITSAQGRQSECASGRAGRSWAHSYALGQCAAPFSLRAWGQRWSEPPPQLAAAKGAGMTTCNSLDLRKRGGRVSGYEKQRGEKQP